MFMKRRSSRRRVMAEVAVRRPTLRSWPQTAVRETGAAVAGPLAWIAIFAVAGLLTSVNRDVT
jgi:hypothetical protein